MSDLEQRLTDTLTRHAEDAPDVTGLAGAARRRARRRRSRRAGVALGLVLAVGAAGAVAAWPESERTPAADGANSATTAVDALGRASRWESWHGVTVKVPDDWGHGSLEGWCANGGTTAPRVEVPGGVVPAIGCTPASAYGLTFQIVDAGGDYEWPVVHQSGDAWPPDNAVGARHVAGVLVTVAAPTADEAQAVLDSVQPIDGRDPNGCPAIAYAGKGRAEQGTLSVCRFDAAGHLEQSELLTGADAAAAESAIAAATEPADCSVTEQGGTRSLISLTSSSGSAFAYLGGCRALTQGDRPTVGYALTADVLYWALSPGFAGDVTGLPLPPELRQE